MYSSVKNVQILISLFKQHNIKYFVNSPGSRNTPLVHSIENDSDFVCFSIVDERSAAYFALGLSEALNEPVCVTCTAATATCNYAPAIKEAYERNIQLVALTADRERYELFQMKEQLINQVNMYNEFVKFAIDVPEVKNLSDEFYANRIINEALLEINHNGKGPIQINYSVVDWGNFSVNEIPKQRKISRIDKDKINPEKLKNILKNRKRIIFYVGMDITEKDELSKLLNVIEKQYNCVVLCDNYSNVSGKHFINASVLGECITKKEIGNMLPDMIITMGTVFYSPIRTYFTNYSYKFEHWHISNDGMINDAFKKLTNVFECSAIDFLNAIKNEKNANDYVYFKMWNKRINEVKYDNLGFTNFSVIRDFCKKVPKDSIVHASVLNAIRISNYFGFQDGVKCYANVGADGIDGALSTYLGEASSTNKLAFLLIGDLSFIYDLNSIDYINKNNMRVLVINNYAGAEFYKNFGLEMIPTIDKHIAARHHTKIKNAILSKNIEYLKANNQEELDKGLNKLVEKNDKPIILEVFTDANTDANTLKNFWQKNRKEDFSDKLKSFLKKILSRKQIDRLKKLLKR